ncbi:MAG: GNAT family N-acetyltransferase [Acidimicrobiales bacterium]
MSEELLPPGYPTMWETHAVLSDGSPVELRPVRPSDRDLIEVFHKRQSPESIYFRFFQHRPELTDKELDYFTTIDYEARMAFVALIGGELVAVARYESSPYDPRPEVAFFVDDRHHGLGLATLLLEYLAAAARSRGLDGFVASVLPENYAMLGVFRKAGFGVKTRFEDGVIQVELDITLTPHTTDVIAERNSRARSRSVARLLRPASVAVVGASRHHGSVGHGLLRSLVDGGFTGEIFPVNPAADEVLGRRCWPSLTAIGRPIDLVVVAVPAAAVEAVTAEAADVGCGGLLIVSSGFAEVGPAGAEREQRLVTTARSNGMRIVGPNAFGLVNTDPAVQLRALFLPITPIAGPLALMSESGPLGGAVLERICQAGLGISSFVAAGNRADVSVNDVLDYWLTDDATSAVLLYVENYGNLRTFARTARTVSARKPIVALRPPDEDLIELLSRSGVILVEGVAGLAEMAQVTASQPLPAGRRVAVVSNAASVARLAVAACRRQGLEVVEPAVGHQAGVGAGRGAVLVADVDVVVPDEERIRPDYDQVLVTVAASAEVDILLVALVPTLELSVDDLGALLHRIHRTIPKPVAAVGLVSPDRLVAPGVPLYTFPEEAARSLGRLAAYAEWRGRQQDDKAAGRDPAGEEAALEAALRPRLRELLAGDTEQTHTLWSPALDDLPATLQLPVAPWRRAGSLDEAVAAGTELGFPVVLKAASPVRRTVGEAGGAAIDLHDTVQLAAAYERMLAVRGPAMLPVVVQRMVEGTAHAKVELHQDRYQGAWVAAGLGGSAGDVMRPLVRRFLPLLGGEAEEMAGELGRALHLDPASERALASLVDHMARLGAAAPELALLRLDPVLVAGPATAAADVELVLRSVRPDPLAEVRRL